MWVEDILKALYFVKNDFLVDKVENGVIIFTNHEVCRVDLLVQNYNYILADDRPRYYENLYEEI